MKRDYSRRAQWTVWVACFVIQLLAGPAWAADKLEANLLPAGLRARSQAPMPVDVTFKWNGLRILEGRLEVKLFEGGRPLGIYRTDDMALTTGEQKFRILLPPSLAPYSDSQVEVQMKFVTTLDTFDLGSSSLFIPTGGERSLVMGWCNSRTARGQTLDLQQSLMFDRFVPPSADVTRKPQLTSMLRLTPEDLPQQPLSYTAFDTMVITSDGFAAAHEGQLQSLARWVKGGGSVCIFVGGGLQPYHVSFLNQLAESSPDDPAFLAGNDGNLIPGQKKVSCLHSGIGRSVVVTGNIGTDPALNSTDWREAVGFLWKLRFEPTEAAWETNRLGESEDSVTNEPQATLDEYAQQAQSFRRPNRPGAMFMRTNVPLRLDALDKALALTDAQKPQVSAALDELTAARQQARNLAPLDRRNRTLAAAQTLDAKMKQILTPDQYKKFQSVNPMRFAQAASRPFQSFNNMVYSYGSPFGVQPTMIGAELMNQLMPTTIRLIPFPALLAIFGLFLVMIGPADYFLLGFFRRRRYTWVLFPAMSIGFTLATMLMANHFLGLHDQRRSLVVVDLDKDGTALRWNRYELVFAARDKQAITDLKDALWVPLEVGAVPGAAQMMPGGYTVMPGGIQITPGGPYGGRNFGGPGRPTPYPYGGTYVSQVPDSDSGPPRYDGTLPSHFRTSESIRQWQPRLNRVFSFEPPPVPLLQNWPAVEKAWPNVEGIRATLSASKPFLGDVCSISPTDPVNPDPGTPQNGMAPPPYGYQVTRDSGSTGFLPDPILRELCFADSIGLPSLVSQISPNGGASFEDLQVMGPRDSALAIVTHVGDDIVVYRRLFHGN